MNYIDKFVLPFRWREFGSWFASTGLVSAENAFGRLKISSASFSAGVKKLEGIRIGVDLEIFDSDIRQLFLCAFLADLSQKELFEPFVGNPERFSEEYVAGKTIKPGHGQKEFLELFIPEQGWVLPSIWRFLVHSIGLKHKGEQRMPDIVVFAFSPGCSQPLFFASVPFDYFGHAQRLKEQIVLNDFFRLLNMEPDADETEIQRAYIFNCREFQSDSSNNGLAPEIMRRRAARFARIKQGYHIWIEKLQKRNRML